MGKFVSFNQIGSTEMIKTTVQECNLMHMMVPGVKLLETDNESFIRIQLPIEGVDKDDLVNSFSQTEKNWANDGMLCAITEINWEAEDGTHTGEDFGIGGLML